MPADRRTGSCSGPLALALTFALLAPAPALAIETQAREAILVDATTGGSLLERNADEPMPPSSMSKIMTALMVFESLRQGRIRLDDTMTVSDNAWRKGGAKSGGSTMFLNPGQTVTVEELLRGIIVQSGNDACIVIAEGLAGSEDAFSAEMTRWARELGLQHSVFKNATGWPDAEHVSTARDLARLARVTIEKYPEYYHYYAEKEFMFNGIRQGNRNPLLYKDTGGDGLKTGHTEAAGYGLTASAVRGDRRLIMVLNGLPSIRARTEEAERLMAWGFREFDNYALLKAGETVSTAEVWFGEKASVGLRIEDDLVVTLPRKSRARMTVTVRYEGPVPAPIEEGRPIAMLRVTAPDALPVEVPLVAAEAVERLGFFGRLFASLHQLVLGQIAPSAGTDG